MRKFLLALSAFLPVAPFAANATMVGDGTQESPWQIEDYEDLKAIGKGPYLYKNHYVLTKDIDASASEHEMCNEDGCNGFISIGKSKDAEDSTVFHGSFDGQNHTISNMTIWLPCESAVGFISKLAGSLSNIKFDKINITGRVSDSYHVGLVGRAWGPITNVHVTNGFVQGEKNIGGIVGNMEAPYGYKSKGLLEDVSFQGTVKGVFYVGGIVGNAENTITHADANVNILVYSVSRYDSEHIGGIAGYSKATIGYSSAKGRISPDAAESSDARSIGGLVGTNRGYVFASYAQMNITGPSQNPTSKYAAEGFNYYIGGLVGDNQGPISSSYFAGNVVGESCVGGIAGRNKSRIQHSYSIGTVIGTDGVAGVAACSNDDATISHTYTATIINGEEDVNNITNNTKSTVEHSYWNTDYSSIEGNNIGKGLSSTEMKSFANFDTWKDQHDSDFVYCEGESSPNYYESYYQCDSLDYYYAEPEEGYTCSLIHFCRQFKYIWDIDEGKTFPYIRLLPQTTVLPIAKPTAAPAWQPTPIIATLENTGATLVGKWTDWSQLNTAGDSIYYNYQVGVLNGKDTIWGTTSYMAVPNKIEISSLNDLKKIGNETSHPLMATYELMADIDGNNTTFKPISDSVTAFTGKFNGNNHTISNLIINEPIRDFTGLFGYLYNATIENLILKNIQANGSWCVGALAGEVDNSIVRRVVSYNGNVTGTEFVGGLVGASKNAKFDMIGATGYVTGKTTVGGVFGAFASIANNVYSVSMVKGIETVGGISGHGQEFDVESSFNKVYSASIIKARYSDEFVNNGSLMGSADVYDGYFDNTLYTQSGGSKAGHSTEELQQQATFKNFDFDSVWTIQEGKTYPYFQGMDPVLPGTLINDSTAFALAGNGTADNPYLIENYDDLKYIGTHEYATNLYYKLTDNINARNSQKENCDANGENCKGFTPIKEFSGVLLGNSKTIYNLTINHPEEDSVGLFKSLTATAKISALRLDTLKIIGKNYVGGLAGADEGASIDSLDVRGSISAQNYAGSAIGEKVSGTITIANTTGSITAKNFAGGIVGNLKNSEIKNSSSTTSVVGESNLGGLVGNAINAKITYTLAAGNVEGTTNIGGLAGNGSNTIWTNSYCDSTTWHMHQTAGGEMRNSAQMVNSSTFENWDFDKAWYAWDGLSYPRPTWSKIKINVFGDEVTLMNGSGTDADPFLITNQDDLLSIGASIYTMNSVYKLTSDINLSNGYSYNSIGRRKNIIWGSPELFGPNTGETTVFSGKLHGAGHSVSGFRCSDNFSLVDTLSATGVIDSLNITDFLCYSDDAIGSFVGINKGTINNVNVSAEIHALYAAGITGKNYGHISNSSFSGSVSSDSIAGGITTENWGFIENSSVDAEVNADYYAGGLVAIDHKGTSNSKFSGTVASGKYGGGAFAIVDKATINNVSANASVFCRGNNSNDLTLGGFVGENNGYIFNSYADVKINDGSGFASVNNGTISSCRSSVDMEIRYTPQPLGGFVGTNLEKGVITDVYATGSSLARAYNVAETKTFDALVAKQQGSIKNAYSTWYTTRNQGENICSNVQWEKAGENVYYSSSECALSSDNMNLKALTGDQMIHAASFNGFDFQKIWTIEEGVSYPTLRFNADTTVVKEEPQDTTITIPEDPKDTTDKKDSTQTPDDSKKEESIGSSRATANTGLKAILNGSFAEFQFTVPRRGEVKFSLLNMQGNVVYSANMGVTAAGSHIKTLGLSGITNGRYIGILQLNGQPVDRTILTKK